MTVCSDLPLGICLQAPGHHITSKSELSYVIYRSPESQKVSCLEIVERVCWKQGKVQRPRETWGLHFVGSLCESTVQVNISDCRYKTKSNIQTSLWKYSPILVKANCITQSRGVDRPYGNKFDVGRYKTQYGFPKGCCYSWQVNNFHAYHVRL